MFDSLLKNANIVRYICTRILTQIEMKTLIEKQILSDLEKSRSGVYENNRKNRKLGRVGQKYGAEKHPDGGEMKEEDKNAAISKEKLNSAENGSSIKITNAQTGSPVITFTKRDGKWFSKNTMTRGEVKVSSEDVVRSVERRNNEKIYRTKVELAGEKSGNC